MTDSTQGKTMHDVSLRYIFCKKMIPSLKIVYKKCKSVVGKIIFLVKRGEPFVYAIRVRAYKANKYLATAFFPREAVTPEVRSKIQSYIAKHQATDQGRFLVYSFDENQHWFGAAFDWLGQVLNVAVADNRILLMAQKDDWKLVPKKECACWAYYFEDITSFSEEQVWQRYKADGINVFQKDARKAHFLYFKGSKGSWSGAPNNCYPKAFQRYGYDAWASEVTKYLYRPKQWVKDYVNRQCQQIGFDENSIAFHVRRGDKISGPSKEGCFISLRQYFCQAVEIRKKTGLNKIFLVTDDDAVIAEAKDMNMGFEIVYDANEVRHAGFVAKYMISMEIQRDQVEEETLTAFKNIHLLTKSKYLIGTRASFFFKLAEQLRFNELGNSISLGENERYFNFRQPL